MSREPRGNFVYHQPSEAQVDTIISVREQCRNLHALLETLPQNRETAIAVTKLEEVSMWANKGIVLEDA